MAKFPCPICERELVSEKAIGKHKNKNKMCLLLQKKLNQRSQDILTSIANDHVLSILQLRKKITNEEAHLLLSAFEHHVNSVWVHLHVHGIFNPALGRGGFSQEERILSATYFHHHLLQEVKMPIFDARFIEHETYLHPVPEELKNSIVEPLLNRKEKKKELMWPLIIEWFVTHFLFIQQHFQLHQNLKQNPKHEPNKAILLYLRLCSL